MRTQTFECLACGEQWTRPAARGQVPKWCPDCRGRYVHKVCDGCDKTLPIPPGSKYCTGCNPARLSGDISRQFKTKAMVRYVQSSAVPRPTVHVRTARRLTSGECRACGVWFVSFHLDVTCSAGCQAAHRSDVRRTHKGRRRARKRDAYRADVSPRKAFEADGYRCHLCNRKTNPRKSVPHPKAPTLDHIIPLAQGGTHEPSNCRTACFQCNSTKGDRGGGEQLLLAI